MYKIAIAVYPPPWVVWQMFVLLVYTFLHSRKRRRRPHTAEIARTQHRLATLFGAWMSLSCSETLASLSSTPSTLR